MKNDFQRVQILLVAFLVAIFLAAPASAVCNCMNWFSSQAPGCFQASATDPWTVTLTASAERICLGFAVIQVYAEEGDDYIEGLSTDAVNETIFAGDGDDHVWGREGDDLIYGGPGADQLYGNQGEDKIRGGQGDDIIDGGSDNDELWGDPGIDHVYGKAGDDVLYGQAGADWLYGGTENDEIHGGTGADDLWGDDGDDDLWGDGGDDDLRGNGGNDRYFYTLGDGNDVLDDSQGNNTLVFRGIVEPSVSRSTLPDGTLVLDISQSGTTGQVQIVDFENRPGWSIAYEDQPNVVLIFADDLGYGDIEPFRLPGSQAEMIYTPNLVRMANEGVRFTQFYSAASHCPPARSALMEGKHTGHTVVNEGEIFDDETLPIMPKLLKQHGYRTALVGKWGMGNRVTDQQAQKEVVTEGDPVLMGFDKFLGFIKHSDAHVYYHNNLTACPAVSDSSDPYVENAHQNLFGYGFDASATMSSYPIGSPPSSPASFEYELDTTRYTQDEFVERAEEVIDTYRREGPFFLYLPVTIPHAELTVPSDAFVVTDANGVDHDYRTEISNDVNWHPCQCDGEPGSCVQTMEEKNYPRWNEAVYATYAAMVSRLDSGVGDILDKLADLRLDSNTLVIFTSDNGPHSATNMDPSVFDSTAGLRGAKYDLLEGGIRVPMIIWRPEHVAAAVARNQPVALWDLLPTLADLAGISASEVDTFIGGEGTDGLSFEPLLAEPAGSYAEHDFLYWEHHAGGPYLQAVRIDNLKLLRHNNDTLFLYDLNVDPDEADDLIEDSDYCEEINNMIDVMNAERSADVSCLITASTFCDGDIAPCS